MISLCRRLCLLLAIPWAMPGQAATVEELQAQGRLSIDASIGPTEGAVARQKLALVVEIATDSWFSGGTRLTLPEVPGLVIMQTEQFASNASETRNSRPWVVQRWTLDVYPQRAGEFTIPPIAATVRVNNEAGDVEGQLQSPATRFSAYLPPGLQADQHWVAAPSFSVTQSFDRGLQGLKVGDAFEREVRFEASDVMAMMLPELSPGEHPGLGIYPSPPKLENTSNRGAVSALRKQRVSYVVEREGEYRLPAQEFFWWDTSRQELQIVRLEETLLSASGGAGKRKFTVDPRERQMLLLLAAGLLILGAATLLTWKYFPRSLPGYLAGQLSAAGEKWRGWRSPALPAELNPGNSAEVRKASRPP